MAAAYLSGVKETNLMENEEPDFDPFEEDEVITEEEPVEPEPQEPPTPDEEEEPPSEDDEPEPKEQEEDDPKEKMIPESKFKAAIKDVQSKLDEALNENAKLTAKPTPDRTADPDGYEKHLRLSMSRELMRNYNEDYDDVIAHYQEMAKVNPSLNQLVEENELPAKFAYDLAKRDMEIRELSDARGSDEWKEFQKWKAGKTEQKDGASVAESLASQENAASKLPKNLNRATSAKPKPGKSQSDDDYLFGDAQIDKA